MIVDRLRAGLPSIEYIKWEERKRKRERELSVTNCDHGRVPSADRHNTRVLSMLLAVTLWLVINVGFSLSASFFGSLAQVRLAQ